MKTIFSTRSTVTESEKSTEEFDSESMRYLSYILYPLCIGGAVYSLVYVPHKSWWSWTIQSVVNGVYAFGFLFMLPQLFVNYKVSKGFVAQYRDTNIFTFTISAPLWCVNITKPTKD